MVARAAAGKLRRGERRANRAFRSVACGLLGCMPGAARQSPASRYCWAWWSGRLFVGCGPMMRRRERLGEAEGAGRRALFTQAGQGPFGFLDAGDVPGGYPPEGQYRRVGLLEPVLLVAQYAQVLACVDVVFQRLERVPDRQVDDDPLVLERLEGGGVACVGLQAPDEARAGFGHWVDRPDFPAEALHAQGVERGEGFGDIDLGQVIAVVHR